MQGIAKAVLISILVSILLLMFINLALFFPWYMTLVVNTFHVSQMAASDNYLTESNYRNTLYKLQDAPIFREKPDDIEITVKTHKLDEEEANAKKVIGSDYPESYYDEPEYAKPYHQRGNPIIVEISAIYPLSITLWGTKYEQELPVSFRMKTTGLRHYKDLDYYYD